MEERREHDETTVVSTAEFIATAIALTNHLPYEDLPRSVAGRGDGYRSLAGHFRGPKRCKLGSIKAEPTHEERRKQRKAERQRKKRGRH